jgi:hypothetical protein
VGRHAPLSVVTLRTMFARRPWWSLLVAASLAAACADPIELDAGVADAGETRDAEPADAQPADAEPTDAEPADAEPSDAGFRLGAASLAPGAQLHETEGHRLRSRLTSMSAVTSTTSSHRLRGGIVPQWP